METGVIKNDIDEAAAIIKAGGLVGVPTETVYGLACNGLDAVAVARLYEVKGRPAQKPLALMVTGLDAADEYLEAVPKAAYALAERFWPGPLTMVMKASDKIPDIVRAGGETVGLRCPKSESALELIRKAGVPLAAPSANPTGAPSPVSAEEVLNYFNGKIEAVIDGGRCDIGLESTIVDLANVPYRVLREGAVREEEIFEALVGKLNIVGITGGTGCGKTTALRVLEDLGALTVDCDEEYRKLLSENEALKSEIEARFPGVTEDGAVNRKALGALVFSDAAALSDLNAITHKFVTREVNRRLSDWARAGGGAVAIDAIALIESGRAKMCRTVVGIVAPIEQRVERIVAREKVSTEYARLRITAQKPDEFYRENCDYILENNGTEDVFRAKCEKLFRELI